MKTHALFILAAIAIATGSAVASDPQWQVIDSHHGSYTYLWRPKQTETTIAFGGHEKMTGTASASAKPANESPAKSQWYFHEITTPHGVVSYYGSTE